MCKACESKKTFPDVVSIPEGSQIKDLKGQRFNMLTCVGYMWSKCKKAFFRFQCDCGNEIVRAGSAVKSGNTKSCGCHGKKRKSETHFKDLTGQVINGVKILHRVPYKNGITRYRCECHCGKEFETNGALLKNGNSKSCGCFQKKRVSELSIKDISGRIVNGIKVIRRVPSKPKRVKYECECPFCEKKFVTNSSTLKSGKVKSCGCYQKRRVTETHFIDLTGQFFGLLLAESISERKGPTGQSFFDCVCKCGTRCVVSAVNLSKMNTRSCGCGKFEEFDTQYSEKQIFKLIINRMRSAVSNSFAGIGISKSSRTHQIVGCSPIEFRFHLEAQFSEGMSFQSSKKWHIDHRIPSSFSKSEEDLYYLNHHFNLQPMWVFENLSKNAVLPPNVEGKFAELKALVDADRAKRGLSSIQTLIFKPDKI